MTILYIMLYLIIGFFTFFAEVIIGDYEEDDDINLSAACVVCILFWPLAIFIMICFYGSKYIAALAFKLKAKVKK